MPRYRVPLLRETIEHAWATVEIDAANEDEAISLAIERARSDDGTGDSVRWDDHGNGYGGSEIMQTPGATVELLSPAAVPAGG